MPKRDFKRELKHLYNPSTKEVTAVDVPPMNFLMIDGSGDPNTSQEYKRAIEALFGLSYALKFMVKKGSIGIDYAVMPLEGLWWAEDMSKFSIENKEAWKWTAMIMQPEFITEELVNEAIEAVSKKKKLPSLHKVRFETYHEGKSAQIMHIGPFSEEGPTVDKIHRFIDENGYRRRGKHHEIYLKDLRKCKPESLKTVIRQPFE